MKKSLCVYIYRGAKKCSCLTVVAFHNSYKSDRNLDICTKTLLLITSCMQESSWVSAENPGDTEDTKREEDSQD